MNASPADQRRLLDLTELDARIAQADRLRQNPPQGVRVKELLAQRQAYSQELSRLLGARDDARTELARIESDVAVVQARSDRDAGRLASSANAKEAQGLESEIASLAKRKSALEDAELEVMERLEQCEAAVVAQEALMAETNAEGVRLSDEAKAVVADATARLDQAKRDRAAIVAALPADLVALYDRTAARSTGAALLRRGTCEGCRMVLSGTDLQNLRETPDNAVVTCPECGCILVRTEESGL
ncbi:MULTISPECIES: zinc ribbon domain-containing protein [unclassified Microbacterium]|uniref:zinc ribbon domain-containing protein n=2 Tax=Microbacterium TaxID=33882 RepID=UPI00214C8D1B|nr:MULTISPECIES: C4-type zinc ribbon domain-containing protein [unclassified Microbacterium]MCR2800913.1 C4-type zinc ribbon domain-containing protein [Microbacterium sp. zg.Y818]MCR2827574.1 C4-type zinc ribbon domain-containing protein [Microbacterium sp. zg.Y909]WIM23623.1 C4-type zinc ribbon domain-containing protein [Microbacterium sp. zg-Y818]